MSEFRHNDEMLLTEDDIEEEKYKQQRNRVYLSPEFIGNHNVVATPSGDVYAFAVILVEIAIRNDPYGVSGL